MFPPAKKTETTVVETYGDAICTSACSSRKAIDI